MSKVVITLAAHRELHEGHRAVINYAKSFGDTKVVVLVDPLAAYSYCRSGVHQVPKSVNVSKLTGDLRNLGVRWTYRSVSNAIAKNEEQRIKIYNKMEERTRPYKDMLLQERHVTRITEAMAFRMMGAKMRKDAREPIDVIVYGPSPESFFLKKFVPLAHTERAIYPHIMRDKDTGISCQGRILDKGLDRDLMARMHQAALGARSMFTVGRNEELLQELKASYKNRPWKWYDISVWENGLVDGRLEIIAFSMVTPEGMILIEDTYYEA